MKILFFGDSITDMGRNRQLEDGNVHTYGDGYVFMIASELIGKNPLDYQIINRGESGNRIVDLYARIKRDVWNLKPDVLSILIGTNDVWHEIGSCNGVDLERWTRVYKDIIKETQSRLPKTQIIIMEPFILKGVATEANYESFLEIKEYAKRARLIAEEFNLPFVKLQGAFDRCSEKFGVERYLYDGVHPNIAGAKIIAEEWFRTFNEKILRSK